MRTAAVVGMAVVLAFAVRVAPAYRAVFTPAGVNFQDNDAWFHMRSVHNLVAHFPSQSGFDPYALFPGGQVLYTEPWDLAVASVAWVLGAGKPGALLVDRVGAWLPAILGAMLPIPVFLLGRRLFGELAGQLSAVAVAVIPGTFLWETHLGVPDHHVAECFLALIALVALCDAAERQGRDRIWPTALAGVALGVYLCVRPAGIFVPGTFAIAALLEPVLAPLMIGALSIGGAVFLTSSGNKWSQHTWLSLAGSFAVCVLAWVLDELWRRKRWPRALFLPAAGVAALAAAGLAAVIKPVALFALVANIRRFLPGGHDLAAVNTIQELYPLWRVEPRGIGGLFEMLGGLWIVALPSLICAIPVAWRSRRPALTLFTVWGLVMTVGGILQLRMLVYFGPVIALAAGAGAAWLINKTRRFRIAASVAFAVFVLATSLPAAIRQTRLQGGPDARWLAALNWLRRNTPEPMGDPAAWWRFWPRLRPGEVFTYPNSAYGVLTWWDFGDWINSIAHRLPVSNGTQVNAGEGAAFLTEIAPDQARFELWQLATRYVVLDPYVLGTIWPTVALWAHRDDADYRKTFFAVVAEGRAVPITVYLPNYFRSMAVRMYIFDGRGTRAAEVSVFTTRRERMASGAEFDVLIAERKFPSEQKAYDYMAANPGENMTLGSGNPTASCVELEDLPWVRRTFTSDEAPLRSDHVLRAVKIFEVTP